MSRFARDVIDAWRGAPLWRGTVVLAAIATVLVGLQYIVGAGPWAAGSSVKYSRTGQPTSGGVPSPGAVRTSCNQEDDTAIQIFKNSFDDASQQSTGDGERCETFVQAFERLSLNRRNCALGSSHKSIAKAANDATVCVSRIGDSQDRFKKLERALESMGSRITLAGAAEVTVALNSLTTFDTSRSVYVAKRGLVTNAERVRKMLKDSEDEKAGLLAALREYAISRNSVAKQKVVFELYEKISNLGREHLQAVDLVGSAEDAKRDFQGHLNRVDKAVAAASRISQGFDSVTTERLGHLLGDLMLPRAPDLEVLPGDKKEAIGTARAAICTAGFAKLAGQIAATNTSIAAKDGLSGYLAALEQCPTARQQQGVLENAKGTLKTINDSDDRWQTVLIAYESFSKDKGAAEGLVASAKLLTEIDRKRATLSLARERALDATELASMVLEARRNGINSKNAKYVLIEVMPVDRSRSEHTRAAENVRQMLRTNGYVVAASPSAGETPALRVRVSATFENSGGGLADRSNVKATLDMEAFWTFGPPGSYPEWRLTEVVMATRSVNDLLDSEAVVNPVLSTAVNKLSSRLSSAK